MQMVLSATAGVAGSLAQTGAQASGVSGATGSPGPFSSLLSDAIGSVQQLETDAQSAVTGLMTGKGVDVHEAMIATERASMAFELALSVRNKAVQAYQQVMGMQF